MPAASPLRQPEHRLAAWLRQGRGRRLATEAQRQSIPELTRVFGNCGLYLRPFVDYPPELSGNMLGSVLTLARDGDGLSGQWACRDDALPIGSGTLALVYSLFAVETSPDPAALVAEIARVLKPEGIALLVCLNGMSPSRLRWMGCSVGPGLGPLEAAAREAGLEPMRRQALGPVWLGDGVPAGDASDKPRLLDPFRVAQLLVMRRRDVPGTPIRSGAPVVALRPGISAG
jgi:SAM-dependent methyltransferase